MGLTELRGFFFMFKSKARILQLPVLICSKCQPSALKRRSGEGLVQVRDLGIRSSYLYAYICTTVTSGVVFVVVLLF